MLLPYPHHLEFRVQMSIKLVDLVRVDQASRFSTGGFRVRLGANTQSYSAETVNDS